MSSTKYPETPDGRYFVAKGRLWRKTNPNLSEARRQELVNQLMQARRDIASAKKKNDSAALQNARSRVHSCKVDLGERGPVWWNDGMPDELRKHPKNSSYADWWNRLPQADRDFGEN